MTLLYTCTSAISVVIWHPQMLGHVLCSEGECLSDAGLVVFAQLIRKLPPLIPLRPGKHKALVSAHTHCSTSHVRYCNVTASVQHPQMLWQVLCPEGVRLSDASPIVLAGLIVPTGTTQTCETHPVLRYQHPLQPFI